MGFLLGLAIGVVLMTEPLQPVRDWIKEQLPWDVKVTPKAEETV